MKNIYDFTPVFKEIQGLRCVTKHFSQNFSQGKINLAILELS